MLKLKTCFMEHKLYERNGTSVVIPIPHSYKDVATLIKSDYFRNAGQILPIYKIWIKTLSWGGSATLLFWFRIAQYRRGWLYYLAEIIRKITGVKYGLQISSRMRVGYGFSIQHSFGTIINPDTIIGNNVTLCQLVNIGTSNGKAALIGDCTFIHPMTCIVDDVVIGKNVTIGAGAVVVRDIPENATAVGVPAHVIHYDDPTKFIGHKWLI